MRITTYAAQTDTPNSNSPFIKKKDKLDQADFMRLMTTQLRHQDPLKPMDNSQMVAQMAQLSTVQGIDELNKTVNGLHAAMSNDQILRGAALVGHAVWVPSDQMVLPEKGTITSSVIAPAAGSVTVTIKNDKGQAVSQFTMPADAAGEIPVYWNGLDTQGKRLPAGNYTLTTQHDDGQGHTTDLNTYVQAKVNSVSAGSDGLYLNLDGLGAVPLDYVLRVE